MQENRKILIDLYDDNNYFSKDIKDELVKTINLAISNIAPSFDLSLCVTIVNNEEIQRLNKETRKIDKPTDVLSFPMLFWTQPQKLATPIAKCDIDPENNTVFLGDIILSKEKIESQAQEFGHTLLKESVYLTLHGVLHLFGYDHMVENDKIIMRNREKEILNDIKKQKSY